MTNRTIFGKLLLLFLFIIAPGIHAQTQVRTNLPKDITIGSIPTMGVEETKAKLAPLAKYIQAQTGIPVKISVPSSFSKLMAAMVIGQVDFAYMGPNNYVEAHRLAGAEAVLIELSPEGKPGYYSVLIASKKSGIKNLDQARGKTFAFTDPDSTSGFIMPNIYFVHERKEPLSSFAGKTEMAGSHIAVVEGVLKGKYDVGATNDMDLAKAATSLKTKPSQFVVLWKSELIPGAPFVARKGLKPEVKELFVNTLVGASGNKPLMKEMQCGGYAPGKDSDFDVIRDIAQYMKK
jgi:phosphonate transport system substrate-binding protein